MKAKHQIFGGDQEVASRVLLLRSYFAGALNLGIIPRQDRPHCRVDVKLTHGVDEQVGSV
jgi:hypothetical protein